LKSRKKNHCGQYITDSNDWQERKGGMRMQIRNEKASCYTCKYNTISLERHNEAKKACKKCATKNGYPGWEPAPGVKVQETKGWIITGEGRPVETIFRKVVE
jgi:hypothetical protein